MMISYRRLSDSVEFFEKTNYQRVEAPWWVSKEIMDITAPPEPRNTYYLEANKKCLVASGEQSFLYMAAKDRLPKGKYQTITPCFRDESIGILRKKGFMKNELIRTDKVDDATLQTMILDSLEFFSTQVPDKNKLKVVKTDIGYDIEYGGIEIGSYGIRSCDILDWVYGTACAEPRTTRAIEITTRRDAKLPPVPSAEVDDNF